MVCHGKARAPRFRLLQSVSLAQNVPAVHLAGQRGWTWLNCSFGVLGVLGVLGLLGEWYLKHFKPSWNHDARIVGLWLSSQPRCVKYVKCASASPGLVTSGGSFRVVSLDDSLDDLGIEKSPCRKEIRQMTVCIIWDTYDSETGGRTRNPKEGT